MMGKLATRDSGAGRQFKPQIPQSRGRWQNRGSYDRWNYDQWSYQNRYRSDSGDRRQYRQDRGRTRYEQNYRRGNFRGNVRNFTDKIAEESIKVITGMKVMTEVGTGLEKGNFPEAITKIEIGVQVTVGPGQDWEPVWIEAE